MLEHSIRISHFQGSAFELGKRNAEFAIVKFGLDYLQNSLNYLKNQGLYKSLGMEFDLSEEYLSQICPVLENIYAKYDPEFLNEVSGFAKGMGISDAMSLAYSSNFRPAGCSQFFVSGMLARDYDDAPNALENEFFVTNVDGQFVQAATSTNYMQRLDGMNEMGLSLSLTFGAGNQPTRLGLGAAMFIRLALNTLSSVDEVINFFQEVGYVTPNNILVADKSGSALIQHSAGISQITRSVEGLFCANSYLSDTLKLQQRFQNPTTKWRELEMKNNFLNIKTPEQAMKFLTSDFPNGLFEPYYSEGLGTLYSVVYEPNDLRIMLGVGEQSTGVDQIDFRLNDSEFIENLPKSIKTELVDKDLVTRLEDYKI